MKNYYPKLKFVINKKKELETFLNFSNWAKNEKGNRSLEWAIYRPYPKLKTIKNKNLSEQKELIQHFINNIYKKELKQFKKDVLKARQDWNKVEKRFFILVDEIFKDYPWPKGKYIAYPTIWGMFPRYLSDKTFLFPYSHNKKNYILIVIAHEMLHFMFYDYIYKKFPKFKNHKYDFILWNVSEIFNTIIQNSPQWVKAFKQKTMSYPEHKRDFPKLRQYWEESKNIDEWIVKSFDYLKTKQISRNT